MQYISGSNLGGYISNSINLNISFKCLSNSYLLAKILIFPNDINAIPLLISACFLSFSFFLRSWIPATRQTALQLYLTNSAQGGPGLEEEQNLRGAERTEPGAAEQ